ncbi:putative Phox domain, PX domain superfamily protein [Plasmopara halstedii]
MSSLDAKSRTSSIFCSCTLRPVSARIVSYGREYQSHRRPTLYVLQVSRSGTADWYVAKRYSEFRELHYALQRECSRTGGKLHANCSACKELLNYYNRLRFPSRHIFQSSLGFSKKRFHTLRMEGLDSYMRFLLETTQGLLGDEDDDDGLPEWGGNKFSKCLVLEYIRKFLMVNEDLTTRGRPLEDPGPKYRGLATQVISPTVTTSYQRRLTRRSSSVTSFRTSELDLVPIEIPSSTDESTRNSFVESTWFSSFAHFDDERTTLPLDAVIYR